MRLLFRSGNGEFRLTKDLVGDDPIPSYAILSHTWNEGQEVTFKNLTDGTGHEMGYKKILFCEEQARHDGLQHFWIDTCCIDRSSKAELQKAINSMFRWYRNATRCYVYLSDVSTTQRKRSDRTPECAWESAFRESRWFTRGWTLQELLAPTFVDFFSYEGKRLGDKSSLQQQICEITGVPQSAIQGVRLSKFSDTERFSWIEYRQTKVEEDKAYSLLGIFDVEMSLRYGEGLVNAFQRLDKEIDKRNKCIQDLRITDPCDDKERIEKTKGGLLKDSYRWILDNADFQRWRYDQQSRLLWIKGDPGKGKTMLLCGIIDELDKSMAKTALLLYFFCQATDSRINNATAVLRGLIYMLIGQQPSLIVHILKKYDHAGKSLFDDANAWVALVEIFTNMLQDPNLKSAYVIIDALDECMDIELPKLLNFIVQMSLASSQVKWIVSSRNLPNIEERLKKAGQNLSLELNAESVSIAVRFFIKYKVFQLALQKSYNDETRDAVFNYLSLNANNTFLWVALVCQNLEEISLWKTVARLTAFPPGLYPLYKRMMEQICRSDDVSLCKRILATIALVYRPLTLRELASVVEDIPADLVSLREIVGLCGSLLTILEDTVYFVHQSAKDYILTQVADEIFLSGKEGTHYVIFSGSLEVMSRTLRRDIYNLRTPGYPIEKVNQPDPDPLAVSRYSCVYWVNHLSECSSRTEHEVHLRDGGAVEMFLRKKYLYWLEALSLCKSISEGLLSIVKLEALIQGTAHGPTILELVRDAHRFIMCHKVAIESAPLQVYASALIFSPAGSLVRALFKDEEPKYITIKPETGDEWGACLQTLEGPEQGTICSIVFSHDSTLLATGSANDTVKIWDASSGKYLQKVEGCSPVVFLHNSTRLASALRNTVKIWDLSSGECLLTLEGHTHPVFSMAFSHDSTRLASASAATVKIWDVSSGECLQTLKGYTDSFREGAFSHDLIWLALVPSGEATVKIWEVSSGRCLQTLEGHTESVEAVAFSYNSTWLASGSSDATVKIWDTKSAKCLQTLKGHSSRVCSVAFSYKSTQLASTSYDKTVKIWDLRSGECLQTLNGHTEWVEVVAFSHNSTRLASGDYYGSVKIWDISSSKRLQMFEDHTDSIQVVVFSHDSTQLASASLDKTVKVWDVNSSKCLQTLKGHNSWVMAVAFSHNSNKLVSASDDKKAKVWDTGSGQCLQTFEGHVDRVLSIAFSYNSAWLASGSGDATVKIWDVSNGKCFRTLKRHSSEDKDEDEVWSVVFSHDSALLASVSQRKFRIEQDPRDLNCTVKIWDANSGESLQTLIRHSNVAHSVAFLPHSSRLASASNDGTVRIWDASSGECVQTLNIGNCASNILSDYTGSNILFDSTGSYLYTNIGAIAFRASSFSDLTTDITSPRSLQYQGWGLGYPSLGWKLGWITYNSENWVWLPPEYRPSSSAVSGKAIAIGVGSGKVWICKFKDDII